MNPNDILEIKLCQEMLGQEVCVVFGLRVDVTAGGISLEDLLEEISIDLGALMNAFQSGFVSNKEVRGLNLTTGLLEAVVPWPGSGTVGGQVLPSFVAASIKLNRTTRITRPGGKRLAGIAEEMQDQGILNLDAFNKMQDVADWFGDSHDYLTPLGGTATVTPVIIGRGADGAYDLSRINVISSGVARGRLTTQNSRKVPFGG